MRYLNVLILIAMAMVALAGYVQGNMIECPGWEGGSTGDERIRTCDSCCQEYNGKDGYFSTYPLACYCDLDDDDD